MKKVISLILGVSVIVLMSGCLTQQAKISGDASGEPKVKKTQHMFVFGLANQPQVIDAAEVCGGANNVVAVETQTTFIDGLVAGLTYNLYTPRTVKVFCAE